MCWPSSVVRRFLALAVLAAAASTASMANARGPLPAVTQRVLRKDGPHGRWHFACAYPQIRLRGAALGVQRGIRHFNRQMKQMAQASLADFKKDLAVNATLPAPIKTKSVRTVEYTVVTRAPGLLAFQFTQFQYLRGQAHPFTQVFTVNFEVGGGFVKLADLFAPHSDYLDNIASVVRRELTAQAKKQQFEIIEPGGYAARAENYRNFVITRSGLKFFLNPYQVAPGYVGVLSAVVPWSALEGDLSDRARRIRRDEFIHEGGGAKRGAGPREETRRTR